MKKKTNKTTISNLHYNLKLIAFSLTLGSAVFKMNSFESLANTNDTVISFEKETMYISENTYNSQYVEDIEVIALKESDEALINKLDYVYEYGYDAATDTKINTDFTITKNNKTYENLSGDDYRLFVAVVAAESSKDFHDALAVASSILNRCDDETWINYLDSCGSDGRNPISHITFSGQYGVYHSGAYKYYLEQKMFQKMSKMLVEQFGIMVLEIINGQTF